jgi:hypothetical protein
VTRTPRWTPVLLAAVALTSCTTSVPGIPSTAPEAGSPAAVPAGEPVAVAVTGSGFSVRDVTGLGGPNPAVSYAVTLRNPNPREWIAGVVSVTATFLDADGTSVAVGRREAALGIRPGRDSAVAEGSVPVRPGGVPVSMSVEIRSVRWVSVSVASGEVTAGPATIRPDTTDPDRPGLLIDCSVTSTYPGLQGPDVASIVYRDAVGTIVGGLATAEQSDGGPIEIPGGATTPLQFYDELPPRDRVPAAECHLSGGAPDR